MYVYLQNIYDKSKHGGRSSGESLQMIGRYRPIISADCRPTVPIVGRRSADDRPIACPNKPRPIFLAFMYMFTGTYFDNSVLSESFSLA